MKFSINNKSAIRFRRPEERVSFGLMHGLKQISDSLKISSESSVVADTLVESGRKLIHLEVEVLEQITE